MINLFKFLFNRERSSIYIYPHSKSRSLKLSTPSWLFSLLIGLAITFFIAITFFSFQQITVFYSAYQQKKIVEEKEKLVKNYEKLIKDYLYNHTKKQRQIQNSIVILFDKNPQKKSIGGSIDYENQSEYLNLLQSDQPLPLQDKFFEKLNSNFYQEVDKDILKMKGIINSIDKFEIFLDQRKRIVKSIPFLLPIVNKQLDKPNTQITQIDSLTKNKPSSKYTIKQKKFTSEGMNITIEGIASIISPSRGLVKKIIKHDNFLKTMDVIISHEFGFTTIYKGLKKVLVKEGDLIDSRSVIGIIGQKKSKKNGKNFLSNFKYQIKVGSNLVNPKEFVVLRS